MQAQNAPLGSRELRATVRAIAPLKAAQGGSMGPLFGAPCCANTGTPHRKAARVSLTIRPTQNMIIAQHSATSPQHDAF